MSFVSILLFRRQDAKPERVETDEGHEPRFEVRVSSKTACLGCGTKNKAGLRFCEGCGRMLL